MTAQVVAEEPGRRERKKQRTRQALIAAAFNLFQAKGFDATTVEEIADAVDVSSRTFFRYFSAKEDLPLTVQEEQFRAVVDALEARPPEEPVLTALRRASVEVAKAVERGEMGFDPAWASCVIEMTVHSPSMQARALEHMRKKQAEMIRVMARRMGVDTDDIRPRIAAAVGSSVFSVITDMIGPESTGELSFSEAIDCAFSVLEQGVNFPAQPSPGKQSPATEPASPAETSHLATEAETE